MNQKQLLLVLALLLATASVADAQTLYGSITGNVKDSSGAVVPGANVSITHKGTNQVRQTVSNEAGVYDFATAPSGTYELTVSLAGFRTYTDTAVAVTINNVTRLDVTLSVGAVSESVIVSAEAPPLQTDTAQVKAEIAQHVLENAVVPLGRNYQNLLVTIPGISPPRNAHSVPSNPSRALRFNANGTSGSSNNIRIDGASSTNVWLPHMSAYVPSLEAIETVNVVTGSFDAEQGLAGGAAVNLQIKSGTNDLHGSIFEYFDNSALHSRPFFLTAKPQRKYNQFGGTIGGPIHKDRLFYFAAYEGTIDRQFAKRQFSVPTSKMIRGDFTETTGPIFDPATGDATGGGRTPFQGNLIPDSRIDPIVKKILPLIPAPNLPGFTNNFEASAPFTFDRHTLDTKVNWQTSNKLSMFGRFSVLKYNMFNAEAFGKLGGPFISSYGGNSGKGWGNTYSLTAAGTYTVNPTFVVDANFGWTRMGTNVEQGRLDEKLGLDFLGIPGTNGPRRFEGGWPRFNITGLANLGVNDTYMPYYRRDPQFQYVANANWIKRTHNIRFGTDFYNQSLNHTQGEFTAGSAEGAQGGFVFGSGPTSGPGARNDSFNNFATFLLGLPTSFGRNYQVPDVYHTKTWSYSLYGRDQWQATPKLTLSLGLRYEYFPIPTRGDRGMERYDFNTSRMLVCGVGSTPKDCGVSVSKNLFAPRVGIAYRATNNFVMRAGYGITNDPYNLARPMRTNAPVLFPIQVTASGLLWAGRLRDGIPSVQVPDFSSGSFAMPNIIGVKTLPADFRRGYIQSWNFSLQRQLRWGWVGEARYVGTRQIRQLMEFEANAGRVGGGEASRPLAVAFGRRAATRVITGAGTGMYDALQSSLERRFANGYQVQVAYTWSKAMGFVNDSDDRPRINIPQYFSRNRKPTDFDRTHNFQMTSVAELPFGKGKRWANSGGAATTVFGGWQLTAGLSAFTGRPFTVTGSGTLLNAPENDQTADQVLPTVQKLGGIGKGQPYYDPNAFLPVSTPRVTEPRFGTAGYNSLRGPGLTNLDLGVVKNIRVGEQWGAQFRAEFLNFTNTPHFGQPDGNASGTAFMLIQNTVGNEGGRDGTDERVIRFALRITF